MSYTLEFSHEAERMIEQAEAYHNGKSPGSGSDLLVAIMDTADRIESNPFQYQVRYDHIRAAAVMMKGYKYFLLYEVLENNVVVIKFVSQASDWLPI